MCSDTHDFRGGDLAIAALAAKQHGVVTAAQLAAVGLNRAAISHRVRRGRLHPVHRGVFLVGHAVAPPWAMETAAVLSVGGPALLSHGSAACIWDLIPTSTDPIDVMVVGRNPRPRAGVRIHRTRRLHPSEVARRHGISVTAPARTLLDLAAVMPNRELERPLGEALRSGLVRKNQLLAILERTGGHHGWGVLRGLLAEGPALTRSEAERRFLALVRAARIPTPESNVRLRGYEVDFVWRGELLVVEVNGYAFHSSRSAFERDRRRDADLQANGYSVMRITWRQLVDEPEALLARLAQRLSSPKWR